jgi:hypothetical protein
MSRRHRLLAPLLVVGLLASTAQADRHGQEPTPSTSRPNRGPHTRVWGGRQAYWGVPSFMRPAYLMDWRTPSDGSEGVARSPRRPISRVRKVLAGTLIAGGLLAGGGSMVGVVTHAVNARNAQSEAEWLQGHDPQAAARVRLDASREGSAAAEAFVPAGLFGAFPIVLGGATLVIKRPKRDE